MGLPPDASRLDQRINWNPLQPLFFLLESKQKSPITVFTRVSVRGAHLILSSQRGALIRERRSFEGGAH